MSYDTAIIECVAEAGDIFPGTIRGDIVFYPVNDTQKIMLGCTKNTKPSVILTKSKSEISGPPLTIETPTTLTKGLTCREAPITWMNKESTRPQGALTTLSNKWGIFLHQIADAQQLTKTEKDVTPEQALNMVLQIPVHELKKKDPLNHKDPEQNVPQLGCFATDVQAVYPPAAHDGKMVDYTRLIPVMLQALKELDRKIDALHSS